MIKIINEEFMLMNDVYIIYNMSISIKVECNIIILCYGLLNYYIYI